MAELVERLAELDATGTAAMSEPIDSPVTMRPIEGVAPGGTREMGPPIRGDGDLRGMGRGVDRERGPPVPGVG